ncbi:MAG: hypothetical protein HUU50_05410 [Candidatus Brocadiae bacterium]|nr:hypothetical protein [Candidatus Brocadiia bacterium]
MNFFSRFRLLCHLLRWRFTWNQLDTLYPSPVGENPKFMTARDAAKLIQDGDVVATSGLAGNQRASVVFRAIRETFLESGHPLNLSLVCTGGQGGRGIVPGTLEELALPGLCKRLIAGHFDTFVKMLRMADEGKIELQCLPQGIIAMLLQAQGQGKDFLCTKTGLGTFVDPQSGKGSVVVGKDAQSFVKKQGEELRYEIPKVNCAIFNAPAADREGNIYVKNCAIVGESFEIAHAARKNQGKVIANVGLLVEKGYDEIFLPASMVDAIVYYPGTEQTGSVPHKKYWSFFTKKSQDSIQDSIEIVRFTNNLLRITPRRTPIHSAIARSAANIIVRNIKPGAFVNIGTGMPEEVSRILYESGLMKDVTMFTEAGVVGGVPAAGIFFGASLCPDEILSSAQVFSRCYEHLDLAVLGLLEADSQGNGNVSRKGTKSIHFIGPGGFIDLSCNAKVVLFISSFMARGKSIITPDGIKIVQRGKPKFVEKIQEITFSGKRAMEKGQKVFFATEVGNFQLTANGLELFEIMPGIDIQKDITDLSPIKIALSPSLRTIPKEVLTGDKFLLQWSSR